MNAPNLSPELFAFHQAWNGGQPITDEAEKHRFTLGFGLRAATIDPRWGRKARSAGAPTSKDTIAYWKGDPVPDDSMMGSVDARDLIKSDGTTQWLGEGDPLYDNIVAYWIKLSPAPAPQRAPGTDLDPDGSGLDDLLRDVARIAEGVETIVNTLIAIADIAKDAQARGVLFRWR